MTHSYRCPPPPPFTQTEAPAHEVHLHFTPPYSDDCFAGHFPDVPVLPGVTLLSWTYQLAERFGYRCQADKIKNLKFTHVIRPHTPLQLLLVAEPAKGTLKYQWVSGDIRCSSGTLFWSPAND